MIISKLFCVTYSNLPSCALSKDALLNCFAGTSYAQLGVRNYSGSHFGAM
ncbi:hypothetical protein COO91_04433 [Nostoc flagelliforme CCNUN1]|uniref:Uncharacterized protein n=1 Tax=Nostoc flagelliforme CCNUN1 TaxID=2038116 RepID=A0A2K8ST18_9NOSO|nr:hypothetical protein COO91_04433 [Nostoc flagelliforme CCNUN1]